MVKIGTHNGSFHCDEALACAMLKTLSKFESAEIVRSRDPKVLAECDIVVDVGAEYVPEENKLDHHQREFQLNLSDIRAEFKHFKWACRTRLSSAGLVYAHYGEQVLNVLTEQENLKDDKEYQAKLYQFVYENLIEEVDGVDNGVDQYSGDDLPERNYKVTTTLGRRVGAIQPSWLDEDQDTDKLFPIAMEMTLNELKSRVKGFYQFWMARDIVKAAILARKSVHASGKAIMLSRFCPWKKHLYLFEEDKDFAEVNSGDILYCLFGDSSGNMRVQCLGKDEGSFENRKSLPKAWCGIRNEELAKVCGLEDSIFCHASGFIAGWKSKSSALKAVEMAIEM